MKISKLELLVAEVIESAGPDVTVGIGMGYLVVDGAKREPIAYIRFGADEVEWVGQAQTPLTES